MADRVFTVCDMLAEKGVELSIPPFMEGRQQLPADEIKRGQSIASLHIHVEHVIVRIKNYSQGNTSNHDDLYCEPNSFGMCMTNKLSTSTCPTSK